MQIKSLPAERQQLKSQNYSVKRGLVVQTGRILALHARGPGFKSQRVHFLFICKCNDLYRISIFGVDLNIITMGKINMAGYEASIAVWVPLIVGLAPGLVYWIAITGMRKRR